MFNTKHNIIVDDTLCLKSINMALSFYKCFQDHEALKSCERFNLNPEIISCLMHAVSSGQVSSASSTSRLQIMRTRQIHFIKWCIKTNISDPTLSYLDVPQKTVLWLVTLSASHLMKPHIVEKLSQLLCNCCC